MATVFTSIKASHEEDAPAIPLPLLQKKLELASTGIAVQLLVPLSLLPFADPACDPTEFFGVQATKGFFDLLHPAHN